MTQILLLSLSTYYIVQLIVFEQGPFSIFEKIRFFLGVNVPVLDMNNEVIDHTCNGSFFATLVSCYICTSFWVAVALCAMSGDINQAVAVAAASSILHRYFDGN